jgi:lipopolysaccharide/colanic/teichoic acid biosynthesis glycosyltransferase
MNTLEPSFYERSGKRLFDLLATMPLLVLITPLMLLLGLCSHLLLGAPVLYRQKRAGYRGRPFELLKFRSMVEARDARGELLPDDERLTDYGRVLRSTSLDELPGLWNVLKGEMSLIGPRPLPVEYSPCYTKAQAQRLEVRPGMAGYAALFGRNAQSWESIFERDAWYVEHIAFVLDMRIVLGVIGVVISRKGIDREDHNCNSEFQRRIETAKRAVSVPQV